MGSTLDYETRVNVTKKKIDEMNMRIKKEREWIAHLRECRSAAKSPSSKKDYANQIATTQTRIKRLQEMLETEKHSLTNLKNELKRRKEMDKKK